MQLSELQRAFQARLLAGRTGIEAQLAGAERADFSERVEVYAGGYYARLVEALATTYPALRHALGEPEFERVMHEFIAAEPSRYYSVRDYGGRVADHLADSGNSPRAQVLVQLARWEWTLADVFDAADDIPAGAEALAAIPHDRWAQVRFGLRGCVRRFVTDTNAVDWWRAARGQGEAPAEFSVESPSDWLLWRRGVATVFRSLGPDEAVAIDAARTGAPFATLCERIAEQIGASDAPLRAASLLRGWFADELIATVEPGSDISG
jgi:hypothetical protein